MPIQFDNNLKPISMSDEEVLNKKLDGLIADEVEAIAGYNDAITFFEEQQKQEIVNSLIEIMMEEKKHLRDLKMIRGIADEPAPIAKQD